MNLPAKIIHSVARSTWTTAITIASSIASLGVILAQWINKGSPSAIAIIAFLCASLFFLSLGYYSLQIRADVVSLEDIAKDFRDINRIYREALSNCFASSDPRSSRNELIPIEASTLSSVCQRISQIFSKLTRKECMVTVKVLTEDEDGLFATTYVRSQSNCERDNADPFRYVVNRGVNTAFDQALMADAAGGTPHFYSGDIAKHKNYQNQRPSYLNYYKSALVVPIRKGPTSQPTDVFGFLAVDSMSRNRINNGHHLTMLAALADQMFNFMSLMRGHYSVQVTEQESV